MQTFRQIGPGTGANVSGPPPKPLKLFKVAVNDDGVQVSRADPAPIKT